MTHFSAGDRSIQARESCDKLFVLLCSHVTSCSSYFLINCHESDISAFIEFRTFECVELLNSSCIVEAARGI